MIVKHRRGTTREWEEVDLIPEAGELVIEECSDGTRKCKIGTGYTRFSKLPYIDDKTRATLSKELATAMADLDNRISKVEKGLSTGLTTVEQNLSQAIDTKTAELEDDYLKRDAAIVSELSTEFRDSLKSLRSETSAKIDELEKQTSSAHTEFKDETRAQLIDIVDELAEAKISLNAAIATEKLEREEDVIGLEQTIARVENSVTKNINKSTEKLSSALTAQIESAANDAAEARAGLADQLTHTTADFNDRLAQVDNALSQIQGSLEGLGTGVDASILDKVKALQETVRDLSKGFEGLVGREGVPGRLDLDREKLFSNIEDLGIILDEAVNELNESIAAVDTAAKAELTSQVELLNRAIDRSVEALNQTLSIDIENTRNNTDMKFNALQSQVSNLIALPEGSTALDAEVINIRSGYDGEEYEQAGDAVRAIGYKLVELEENILDRTVNGLYYEDNQLYLTSDGNFVGNPVTITGGSGDGTGGGGYSVRLYTTMATTLTVATADVIELAAQFYEKFDRESTQAPGALEVLYKLPTDSIWTPYISRTVTQDEEFKVDIAPILNLYELGTKVEISFKVTAGESKKESELTFKVDQINAYIEPINFDNEQLFTKDFKFYYKCIGRGLKKTVYFEIDGELCVTPKDVGTSHNATLDVDIPITNYAHGAHELTAYYKTPEGATSNKAQYILLYNDGTNETSMVGASCNKSNITYGDALQGKYMVSTPKQDTTDLLTIQLVAYDENGLQTIYYTNQEEAVRNNKLIPWEIMDYPTKGNAFVSFMTNDDPSTTKTIQVHITESKSNYDLNPIKSGLIYAYNASGKTNSTIGKESYEYSYTDTESKKTATIDTVFEGFNWVSDGYPTVEGEDTALVLSGTAKHTIKLPMFSTSYFDKTGNEFNLGYVSNTGRTFEIEFKVSNVTDPNAPIITCMPKNSDNNFVSPGFVITPQVCYLLQKGANVKTDETGFIENEATIAAAYIKDNSRVRVTFVVEKQHVGYTYNGIDYPGQCINVYVNGQFANSLPYADGTDFSQNEFITIGSDTCITRVYEIRVYNHGLSAADILQNYKASPQSVNDKIIRFKDNDVLNEAETDVDYHKAIKKYPCLLLTGELSTYTGKNDGSVEAGKAPSGVTLTKPSTDNDSGYTVEFELLDKDSKGKWLSSNKIQGTTSKTYPIKNYKAYLAKADGFEEDGITVKSKKVKYSLKGKDASGKELSIGESTLCWKCDYMSTDHANTFNANLADTLFGDKTLAQQENPLVQNTVYGFRCLLFQRDDEDSPIKFIGDGALNNDKSNAATFGLKCADDSGNNTTRQKWEIRNNTELISTFESDRLFAPNGDKKLAYAALESTYPDQGDLDEEGIEAKYDYIQTLYTWVCQRANFWDASTEVASYEYNGQAYNNEREYRKAIFINEFEKHFNKNHALVYYLFCEFTALCDNRAKNMFLRCEDVKCESLKKLDGTPMSIKEAIADDGTVDVDMIDWENSTFAKWITDLYDLDSCYGVENTGKLEIPYYADWKYELNGTKKFNSYESRLWLMFEEAFAEDIKKKAQALTSTSLNYETVYESHIKENALNTCPAVVNRDMNFKYHDPWIDGFTDYTKTPFVFKHDSTFKYLQRGSRAEQKDAFISKRFNMLYSKYLCGKCTSNQLNFRCATAIDAKDSAITLEANQVFYPAIRYGDADFISGDRTNPNTAVTMTGSSIKGEDFIYIGGASYLTDIGDISKFKPYLLDLGSASSLKRLILGSDNIVNEKIHALELSNCPLLEELNIVGCVGLKNANVDLSANKLLRKVSASTPVKLPNGGILDTLYFKDPERIEVLNQTNLKTFTCVDADNADVIVPDEKTGKRGKLSNLYKLWVENTPAIPALALASEYIGQLTGGLRLVGVNETLTKEQLLELASEKASDKYINIDGNLGSGYPHITGTCEVADIITGEEYNQITSKYPDLKIDYAEMHTNVTFKYQDSTGEERTKVIPLTLVNSQTGDLTNHAEIPEAYWPEDDAFTYTFKGWSEKQQPNNNIENTESDWKDYELHPLKEITGDCALYPVFEAVRKSYTVKFVAVDKTYELEVPYGEIPDPRKIAGYKEPTKEQYVFTGWHTSNGSVLGKIKGDTTCYAQFSPIDTDADGYPGYTLGLNDIECTTNGNAMSINKCINHTNVAVKVPETFTIEGSTYNVTSLKGFNDYTLLTYIDLPDTLLTLGDYAFNNCTSLDELELPTKLTSIGDYAFNGCADLSKVEMSKSKSLTSIGNYAFKNCTNLSEIQLPARLTSIGKEAFDHCTSLTSIEIPSYVNTLGSTAFSWCGQLQEVTLPDTLTTLPATCFSWCSNLSKVNCNDLSDVNLPAVLETIESYVFNECNLTNVKIPSKVHTIGPRAFGYMTSLKKVTFTGSTLPTCGDGGFSGYAFSGSGPIEFHLPWTYTDHTDKYATNGRDIFLGAKQGSKLIFVNDIDPETGKPMEVIKE